MIVVDASVAVKWLVPEHGSDAADRLLTTSQKLFAPDLIRVEVAAALTRRFRTGQAPEGEVREDCDRWPRLLAEGIVTLTPAEQDYPEAAALALQLKHPFQDCLYLALARRLQAPLVTADPKFIERAARFYPAVRALLTASAGTKPH
jgi:predicted nucleic acid-binding protein